MNLKILKNRNFLLIALGGLISALGTRMLTICLSLYVLEETGSAGKFASVLAISIIPTILLGPIAGVLADNFNKKKILVFLDFLSGCIILYYCFNLSILKSLSINNIYILVILLSIISAIYNPTTSSLLPHCIKKEDLMTGNGLLSMLFNLANLVGPILGTSLFGFYGLFIVMLIDSISFFISSFLELFITIGYCKTHANINIKSFISDFKQGLLYIKNKPILLTILILGMVVNMVYSPIMSIGLNYITKINLCISDYKIGILNSIITLATFLSPFLCSKISKKLSLGKILFGDILLQGILFFILCIISSNIYIKLFDSNLIPYISIMVIGFFITLICCTGNLALTTIIQKQTPLSFMGRVQATLSSLLMITTPIGQIIFGFLFDNFISSLCILVASVVFIITIFILRKPLIASED